MSIPLEAHCESLGAIRAALPSDTPATERNVVRVALNAAAERDATHLTSFGEEDATVRGTVFRCSEEDLTHARLAHRLGARRYVDRNESDRPIPAGEGELALPTFSLSMAQLRQEQETGFPQVVGATVMTILSVGGLAGGTWAFATSFNCSSSGTGDLFFGGGVSCRNNDERVFGGLAAMGGSALSLVIGAVWLSIVGGRDRELRTAMQPEVFRLFHNDDVSINIDVEAADDGGALTVRGTY